jgi:hypothetical protein
MRHQDPSSSPIHHEPALRALLALLATERTERRPTTPPRTETILARAGLTNADIAVLTGSGPADIQAVLDSDASTARPSGGPTSVIDRARAHMARNAT